MQAGLAVRHEGEISIRHGISLTFRRHAVGQGIVKTLCFTYRSHVGLYTVVASHGLVGVISFRYITMFSFCLLSRKAWLLLGLQLWLLCTLLPSYTTKNLPWVHSFDCYENHVLWDAFALIMGLLGLRCESLLYVGEEILRMATDEYTVSMDWNEFIYRKISK